VLAELVHVFEVFWPFFAAHLIVAELADPYRTPVQGDESSFPPLQPERVPPASVACDDHIDLAPPPIQGQGKLDLLKL
jgi:hypothetical protein